MNAPFRIHDRDPTISIRSAFIRARKLEASYAAKLRRIARHVGDIVREMPGATHSSSTLVQDILRRYSDALTPWAEAVADRMVTEVAAYDAKAWRKASEVLGRTLHREIETAPTGVAMRAAMTRQVGLIKSLPTEAAERVHKLTIEGLSSGRRTAEIVADIMRTGEVTRSRADLIATTEVSRTASTLTQVRAEHVGSTHYFWRTVGDRSVRRDHKILNGKVFAWAEPPVADLRSGEHANPGCIFRCRCFAEPIF